MNKAETIAQIKTLLAQLEEALLEQPQKPAIRSVKIGDREWQADVPEQRFTWEEAKAYAASLGDGWRLPTVHELLSLVDYTKAAPACSVFPDCPSVWFWTSDSSPNDSFSAWYVNFDDGNVYSNYRGSSFAVRCFG